MSSVFIKKLIPFLIFFIFNTPVIAEPQKECTFQNIFWIDYKNSIKRKADLGAQEEPIINQLRIINNKAKNSNLPIKDQLSPEDIYQFDKLAAQLKILQTYAAIEDYRQNQMDLANNLINGSNMLYEAELDYLAEHSTLDGFNNYLNKLRIDNNKKKIMLQLWKNKIYLLD